RGAPARLAVRGRGGPAGVPRRRRLGRRRRPPQPRPAGRRRRRAGPVPAADRARRPVTSDPTGWEEVRGRLSRMGLSIAVASGAYGLSFGALSTAGGLSVPQTCALSVLVFTGGS